MAYQQPSYQNINPYNYPSAKPRGIEKTSSTEPIVGLRVWKVITEGGLPKLRSVYKETVWPYRKAMEKDSLHDMGIHAVKTGLESVSPSIMDPTGMYAGMDVLSLFKDYQADVAGEVYLWGKVEEHQLGYLAEFAYPKKLFLHEDFDPVTAMQLEDEYGVPCEYRSEFRKIDVKKEKETVAAILQQMTQTPSFQAKLQGQGMQQAQANAQMYAQMHNYGLIGNALGKSPFGI